MAEAKQEQKSSRCKECGFRIRGANHAEGAHHKSGSQGPKRSYNPHKVSY